MAVFQRILSKDKIRYRKSKRFIKTSSERYRDVNTGRIISRRERDKLSKAVPKSLRQKERNIFYALRDSFIAKQRQKGNLITARDVGLSDDFTKIVRDLEKGKKLKREGKTAEGNTLIRRALQRTTRRDGIDRDVIPGESPKRGEGGES